MKDRIGNKLAVKDKVLVELPTSSIIGFIAEAVEPGLVAVRRGTAAAGTPGRLLVSVVFALPVDPETGSVAQVVKVYDPDTHEAVGPSLISSGTSGPSKAN